MNCDQIPEVKLSASSCDVIQVHKGVYMTNGKYVPAHIYIYFCVLNLKKSLHNSLQTSFFLIISLTLTFCPRKVEALFGLGVAMSGSGVVLAPSGYPFLRRSISYI